MGDEDRFLRLEEVLELCGLSRSHLYRLMAEVRFPRQVLVGERSSRWRLTEVTAWMNARDDKPPGIWQ